MRAYTLVITAVLAFPALAGAASHGRATFRSMPLAQSTVTYASRPSGVRFGGVVVGAGYTRGFYPYYWYGGWPYYSPFYDFYLPMYYPGYYGYARSYHMGEIKLRVEPRNAQVYVNGAYAGKADRLKTIWLAPGAYNLELKADQRSFQKRIYVLTGKTLKIDADLTAGGTENKP